jgi:RecB family exonuclease
MERDRIQQALARIEAAAARIEVAARPDRSPAPEPDLVRKHEALKREAWAALAEIDTLIEAMDA